MPSSFETTRRVAFCETDMAGIVHFSYFYRYMEDLEHAFFRSLGLSIMHKRPDGTIVGWPRVSAKCNFKAPLFFEDEFQARVEVERIGVKSLTFQFLFTKDAEEVAKGTMKTVCCEFGPGEPMRSIAIPPDYLEKIEEVPRDPDL
jgi:YbgC/YbaW family acyl-CoA thioester hydrolase